MKIKKLNFKIDEILGADLRSLALLRILLGVLVILDLWFRFPDIKAFYSDEGIIPRAAHLEIYGSTYLSVFLMNGLPLFVGGLFLVTIFFAILFIFGLQTRVSNIVLWFFMNSLHARNPLILTGGDTLFHLILFWCMFLPVGACFSIDRLFKNKNNEKQKIDYTVFSVGTIGLFTQIMFMYCFTAACKVGPEWMKDGSAIYYALNIDQYVTPLGHYLLNFPALLKLLTPLVFWFEAVGPLFLFFPAFNPQLRLIIILGFLCLQIGFGSCLIVGIFPYIASVAILSFLPAVFWDLIIPSFLKLKILNKNYEKLSNVMHKATSFIVKNYSPCSLKIKSFNLTGLVNFIATCSMITILLWNIQSLESLKFRMPNWLSRYSYLFGVEQQWVMFGSKFLKDDFWYVYSGVLKNGNIVDIFNNGSKLTWDRPKNFSRFYPNHRWSVYIRSLWVNDPRLKPYYAQYLCKEWNKKHKPEEQLVDIYFYYARDTLPDNETSKPEYGLMYSHRCY